MLGHAIVEQGWRISSRLSSNAPALHPFLPRRFPATRARGSRDLRPRVTRPAPAGRWLCAEEKRKDALKIRESPLKIRESPFKNQEDSTTKQAKGKSPKP